MAWERDLVFSAHVSKAELTLDGAGSAGGSPVDLLVTALTGCMAMDLAYILNKGRYSYRALRARLAADRAPDVPHRITAVTLHFVVDGDVPSDTVERALRLSREKYCSVWHSMRQDIDLQVTFDLNP